MTRVFFGFPSTSNEVTQAIEQAAGLCRARVTRLEVIPWTTLDVAGRFIKREVLAQIDQADVFFADVSTLNMNVAYEVGYAIGTRKPVRLVVNSVHKSSLIRDTQKVGIFDTIGFHEYSNGTDLAEYLLHVGETDAALRVPTDFDRRSPVYVVDAPDRTELVVRITHYAKRFFVSPKIFDPSEKARLSAPEAIDNVARARLVIVSLVPEHYPDSSVHNIRSAFVAGLAHGCGRQLLIFQLGTEAPPLDFRDDVTLALTEDQIDRAFQAHAPEVFRALLQEESSPAPSDRTFLEDLNIGSSVAEDEEGDLLSYYYLTDAFHRAERGEARVILGRKGSGKTALFYALARRKSALRQNVVLDLQPESYQLVKFKEGILRLFQPGTQLHILAAMWDYVLLLEIAYRLLHIDQETYHRNHRIFDQYVRLKDVYYGPGVYSEADFSERLSVLIETVRCHVLGKYGGSSQTYDLSNNEVTELIYRHPISELRACLVDYLREKEEVWILIDHLDKGWSPTGLADEDVRIVSALLEASGKLQRSFLRSGIECRALIFLRNDVFELLVDRTPDSGKITNVSVDWTDTEALKQMLKMRLVFGGLARNLSFGEMWLRICCAEVAGQASDEYILTRCLMRPRALLGHIAAARNRAVNRGHERIEEEDVLDGVRDYSRDLLREIMKEIGAVAPELEDGLYALIDTPPSFSKRGLYDFFKRAGIKSKRWDRLREHLLWYGIVGIEVSTGDVRYIYDFNYDSGMLMAVVRRQRGDENYWLNPAFRPALAVAEPQGGGQATLL